MDIQKMVDAMSAMSSRTRSQYHLTLGALIEALKSCDPDKRVIVDFTKYSPFDFHSYRGYYSDLALEQNASAITAGDFLAEAEAALGATFEGYKGGDFVMDEETPLWISSWGNSSGIAVMDYDNNGDDFVLITKQVRD